MFSTKVKVFTTLYQEVLSLIKNIDYGRFDRYATMKKIKTLCSKVDWNGFSVTEGALERTLVREGSSDAPWKGRWQSGNQPLTLPKGLFLLVTRFFSTT